MTHYPAKSQASLTGSPEDFLASLGVGVCERCGHGVDDESLTDCQALITDAGTTEVLCFDCEPPVVEL